MQLRTEKEIRAEITRCSTSRITGRIFLKLDGLNVENDKTEQMFIYFHKDDAVLMALAVLKEAGVDISKIKEAS